MIVKEGRNEGPKKNGRRREIRRIGIGKKAPFQGSLKRSATERPQTEEILLRPGHQIELGDPKLKTLSRGLRLSG